ncbi:acyltransferase family protein [Morganella morganii]|uniref:acyltransferase family protein n=1 Tax=Morganella morganii TaxID=582 RepID=UPI0021D0D8E5|nr:acyltransferase [Morganella morganii]MCU6350485.1 acyltransferase [Morganella morganii]
MQQKYNAIQALRWISALLVIGFHSRGFMNDIYAQKNLGDMMFVTGAAGVDIFFVISGFIISLATSRKESIFSFYIKRIFRIYPVYIFLVVSLLLLVGNYNNSDIVRSLFMIHNDYKSEAPTFGYSLIFTTWSLTYELYFYIIFSLAMLINHKYRVITTCVMILAILMISQIYTNGTPFIDAAHNIESNLSGLAVFLSNPISIDFIYGCLIYTVYSLGVVDFFARKINANILIAIILSGLALSFIIIFSNYRYGYGPLKWGMLGAAIVFLCVAYDRYLKFEINRVWIYLGDISYSIYLTHVCVLVFLNTYGGLFSWYIAINGISRVLFIIITSIVLSVFTYELIEKRGIKLGKSLISMIERNKS